jgi:hypothetical protein
MSIAEGNLITARSNYEIAEKAYWVERDRGGIVELDRTVPAEQDAWHAGQRWKCVSPEGFVAMGKWQKAKAELDAANAEVMRERGYRGCPTCPGHEASAPPPVRESMPDSRLPVERDEDAAVFP